MATLSDMNKPNVIDTTQGKIEPTQPTVQAVNKPINRPIMDNNDPIFAPPTNVGRGMPINSEGVRRTPTTDELPPQQPMMPKIDIANANIMSGGSELIDFDVNSLPKRPAPPPEPNHNVTDLEAGLKARMEDDMKFMQQTMDEYMEVEQEKQREEEAKELDDLTRDSDDIVISHDDDDIYANSSIHIVNDDYEDEHVNIVNDDVDVQEDNHQEEQVLHINEVEEEDEVPEPELHIEDNYASIPMEIEYETDDPIANDIEEEPAIDVDNKIEIPIGDDADDISESDLKTISSSVDSDDDVTEDGRNEDAMLDELKKEIKRNIVLTKNRINLSNFSVAKTPIAASKAISFNVADLNRADWMLYDSKCGISCSGLNGPEIFALNPDNNPGRSRANQMKDIYSIIYKHIISPKPKFETWMKTTRFSDLQHIYFALFRATFKESNFVYHECSKCNKVFLQNYDFEDMVIYKNDEVKKEVHSLFQNNSRPSPIMKDRYQVSDKYVVDILEPTIWSMLEISTLSTEFIQKYEELIDVLSFLTDIYIIDPASMSLIPIDTNPDPKSTVKTISRRIATFAKVIRDLPSDNFIALRAYVTSKYNNVSHDDVKYRIPAAKCPKCGNEIPEIEVDASSLLFTRHQLAVFRAI